MCEGLRAVGSASALSWWQGAVMQRGAHSQERGVEDKSAAPTAGLGAEELGILEMQGDKGLRLEPGSLEREGDVSEHI